MCHENGFRGWEAEQAFPGVSLNRRTRVPGIRVPGSGSTRAEYPGTRVLCTRYPGGLPGYPGVPGYSGWALQPPSTWHLSGRNFLPIRVPGQKAAARAWSYTVYLTGFRNSYPGTRVPGYPGTHRVLVIPGYRDPGYPGYPCSSFPGTLFETVP
eukprot:243633-Rhodomonas_salina.1